MTIAAGFVVRDGVLICSDSEHSAGGILTHEPKLTRAEFYGGKVIFASAGNADLASAAIQKCIHVLHAGEPGQFHSEGDVAHAIEDTINAEYRKHVSPEVDPNADSVYEVLAAIWCGKEGTESPAALYRTWQGSIRKSNRYECIGSGYYLGHYLIESMVPNAWDIERARVVATYTLAIAKRFVDGCGGNTHIASLRNDGTVSGLSGASTEPLEKALLVYDQRTTRLLFALLNERDSGFSASVSAFNEAMLDLRRELGLDEASRAVQGSSALEEPPTPGPATTV